MVKKQLAVLIPLAIIVGIIYFSLTGQKNVSSNVPAVTTSDFDQKVLQSKEPVLVDFWASWCPPCRQMSPIVDEIYEEYAGKISVYKVDIDDNKELASRYEVESIPTLMIFKDGELADRQAGLSPKENITQWIDDTIGE